MGDTHIHRTTHTHGHTSFVFHNHPLGPSAGSCSNWIRVRRVLCWVTLDPLATQTTVWGVVTSCYDTDYCVSALGIDTKGGGLRGPWGMKLGHCRYKRRPGWVSSQLPWEEPTRNSIVTRTSRSMEAELSKQLAMHIIMFFYEQKQPIGCVLSNHFTNWELYLPICSCLLLAPFAPILCAWSCVSLWVCVIPTKNVLKIHH